MAIDVSVPESPGWWLLKLAKKREERLPRLEKLAQYHDGNPPLPSGSETMRDAYKAFQKKARTNFAELIVGSVRERCSVRAVRTSAGATIDGDSVAWNIWRDNNLDIEFADVLENMLALGDGYMMVSLDPSDENRVVITGEDPRLVVTIHDPLDQSEVRAGLKMFHDPDRERDYAFLFLRGGTDTDDEGNVIPVPARRFVASRSRKTTQRRLSFTASAFDWDEEYGGADGEPLNHRFVPIVRFRNRRGIGEFEPHIDVLDRINHTLLQRMVIAMYQAFRLRAIRVDESDAPDRDPETGEVIDYDDLLSADPGAFLKIPKDAELWESNQADLQGVLSSIKDDLLHLMAVTRTPMSAVSDSVQQSAEGAALVKEGQLFKTEDKQKRAGASLVLVFMIAFLCLEDEARAQKQAIRIDWSPAERFSLQQKYDAYSKGAGLPEETRMAEILQFSPEQIALAKAQLLQEMLLGVGDESANASAAGQAAGKQPDPNGAAPTQA